MMRRKVLAFLSRLSNARFLEALAVVVLGVALAFDAGWYGDQQRSVAISMDVVPASNLLENGGFEVDSWTHEALYWTPGGGPYSGLFGPVFTPASWTTWWREGFPCASDPTAVKGAAEVLLLDLTTGFPYPARIRSGSRAVRMFTFWRCHEMGLLQQVDVVPGAHYDLMAYGHAWYSECESELYSPPLAGDCETPLPDAWDRLQVGIDPSGGLDPHGSMVVWSAPVEQYGVYGQRVDLIGVQASATQITVFLRSECNLPLKHADTHWDDVVLQPGKRLYLPLLELGHSGGE